MNVPHGAPPRSAPNLTTSNSTTSNPYVGHGLTVSDTAHHAYGGDQPRALPEPRSAPIYPDVHPYAYSAQETIHTKQEDTS